MTTQFRLLLPFAAVLVMLTFLLLRAGTPGEMQHERVLGALRTIDLQNASLQRDALRARSGLITEYDALSFAARSLREEAEMLVTEVGSGLASRGARLRDEAVVLLALAEEQEDLLERFKTQNALLQNSRRVFQRAIRDLVPAGGAALDGTASDVVRLAAVVVRMASDPGRTSAQEIREAAERLGASAPGGQYQALTAHARIIADALPVVDAATLALQNLPIAARVQQLHESYLQAYGDLAALARLFRIALYGAAVILAGYTIVLILRLGRSAERLRQRLAVETMVASISSDLLNLPDGQFGAGMRQVLARVGQHLGADRAQVTLRGDDGEVAQSYEWVTDGLPQQCGDGPEILGVFSRQPPSADSGRSGVAVRSVNHLPPGPDRRTLERCGVGSWLVAPFGQSGQAGGVLYLASRRAAFACPDGEGTMLRTIANILSAAFAREQAAVEREALRTRLTHAERLEALGTLAGGIAHEFNNVLGSMLGHAELALARLKTDSSAHRYVTEILSSGAQAKVIIAQILAFSRAPQLQFQLLRPQPVVEEAIEMMRIALPPTVRFRSRMAAPEAVIEGDAAALRQVVTNLCTNAAQAIGRDGVIELGAEVVGVPEGTRLSHGLITAGEYFRLTVTDTGSGIPPALLGRIFEPFFTTKSLGQGTGLGLAVVHGIVMDHHGAIDVTSRPGAGSRFAVFLPLSPDRDILDGQDSSDVVPRGDGQTILVFEAEARKRLLAEEMVAALGYEPVGFGSAAAAIERLRADPEGFDLILAEANALGDDGMELARAARSLRPDLPVLLMTRPEGTIAMLRSKPGFIRDVLPKPLQSRRLGQSLGHHLPAPVTQ